MQFDIKYAYFNFLQSLSYKSSSLNPILSWGEDEDSESSDAEVWEMKQHFACWVQVLSVMVESSEKILNLHLCNI